MANYRYDPMLAMNVPVKGTKAMDASRGHEIVRRTENYLNSIGKNNSTGKYDKIVMGVKSLLEQGFLKDDDLDKAVKQEANRLLKKYSLDAEPTELMNEGKCSEGMTCDASIGVQVNLESLEENFCSSRYSAGIDVWDYFDENSKYSDDEKGFERCKKDYIKELTDLANEIKRECTRMVDASLRKYVSEINKERYH